MMKIYFAMLCFSISFISNWAQAAPTDSLYYLHIEANLTNEERIEAIEKLRRLFVVPLVTPNIISRNSYIVQISGPQNHLTFNLVLESLNSDTLDQFNNYMAFQETKLIYGQKVSFQKVAFIKTTAVLEIGSYDGKLDDPFVMKYDYPQFFKFSNLAAAVRFSDGFGFALLSTDHQAFKSYLMNFAKEAADLSFITQLLSQNNMMAIRTDISLVLENGAIVSSDWEGTPFLPYRFFRNCYESRYENGTCL